MEPTKTEEPVNDAATGNEPQENKVGEKVFGLPVITARGVTKTYPIVGRDDNVAALKDINLFLQPEDQTSESKVFGPIRQGEFVMIRGPSGGGKTTLLNIIGTIDHSSSGEIEICGQSIGPKSTDRQLSRLRLAKIGFVFQTFNLLATISALENVELPMVLLGKLNHKQRRRRATDLMTQVGLQDRLQHLPSEMSGGEMQRTSIARALANEPEILLLDEPTGDLDTPNTIEVMDLLLRVNLYGFEKITEMSRHATDRHPGTTCIMVTHNPDLECYADRILYVKDGRFDRQEFNPIQRRLRIDAYLKHLHAVSQG